MGLIFGTGPVAAQAQSDPGYFTTALWELAPIEASINSEPQTAALGDLLFQQPLRSTSVAVLTSRVSVDVPGAFFRSAGEAVFDPGSEFFQLTGVGGSQIFCPSSPALGGLKRVCLYDREADGVFDRVFWMPITATGGSVFAGMFISRGGRSQERNVSAPYRLDPSADTPLMVCGPVITRSALGAYRVTLAIRDNGDTVALASGGQNTRAQNLDQTQDAQTVYFRAEDVPLTIVIGGARIEFEAVEGNRARYRVHSAFDPSHRFAIGYSRPFPIEPERAPRTGR